MPLLLKNSSTWLYSGLASSVSMRTVAVQGWQMARLSSTGRKSGAPFARMRPQESHWGVPSLPWRTQYSSFQK